MKVHIKCYIVSSYSWSFVTCHLNGLNVFTAVALMLHMYLGLKLCSIHQLELVNINYQMQI